MTTVVEIKTLAAKLREELYHTPTPALPPWWGTASLLLDGIDQLREDPSADLETLRVVLDSALESGGSANPMLRAVAAALGLGPPAPHLWAEKNYGWREDATRPGGGVITVTGTALCGSELKYAGNWEAFDVDSLTAKQPGMCPACVSASQPVTLPESPPPPSQWPPAGR